MQVYSTLNLNEGKALCCNKAFKQLGSRLSVIWCQSALCAKAFAQQRQPQQQQPWPHPDQSLPSGQLSTDPEEQCQCATIVHQRVLLFISHRLLVTAFFMGENNEHQSAEVQLVDQQDDPPVQDENGRPSDKTSKKAKLLDHTTDDAGDDRNERISDEPMNEEEKPICRICHCSSEDLESGSQADCSVVTVTKESPHHCLGQAKNSKFDMDDPFFLITPCFCTGSLQYVHHKCLQHWIRSSNRNYCELCKYTFKLKKKSKPIYKWECLNILTRKLVLQLLFNFITITFVILSIYVIAERAAHQMVGQLDWRFWLKMLIVTIGFLCGILFIFFQLKIYISTIIRWKQYNQIIIIENANSNQPMTISTTIEMASNESK